MNRINVAAYFERITYDGDDTPTLKTLRALHRAHLLSVPFENLDIHIPRPIMLTEEALFDKIVTRRRGGFCYEQNGFFALILQELGFSVTLLEARVKRADGTFGIPFDHLTLLVQLEERWLADVGFGASFMEPLQVDNTGVQIRDGQAFHLSHDGQQGIYSIQSKDGTWRESYQFFLKPRQYTDFLAACHYHQNSSDSIFTQNRMCTMATPGGRVTLSGSRLIVTEHGQREEQDLPDEGAVEHLLSTRFRIRLPL